MSNIEKIKAEIERQLEYFKGKEDDAWDDSVSYTDEDALWYQGHWKMCSRLLAFINSLPEETNEAASTMAPSCWGEEQGEVELVNDLEEDALLLERAWLTLDGFGHEELAGRLRQFAERKGLIWK